MTDNINRYGPQKTSDAAFTKKARLLQSWYRVEIAKQKHCGPWQKNRDCVGSTLVDGESTGANYISPKAFAYALERLEDKKQREPYLVIEPYRLLNNMLSSQPMCFNLFSDLRAGVQSGCKDAQEVLAAIFAEAPIATVREVTVEVPPQPPERYINDKTAFDAFIRYEDESGRFGLVGVETKYSDSLGTNEAKVVEQQRAIARELHLFDDDDLYTALKFDQIVRNLLLTLVYGERHGFTHAINFVLGPAADTKTPKRVEYLKQRLSPQYRDRIVFVSLEEVVERGLTVAGPLYADHLRRFHARYLDFSQIDDLAPK